MDYNPNPAAHIRPPIERPHYHAPTSAHRSPDYSHPHYNAPLRSHIPYTQSLSHYSTPPSHPSPPPYSAAPPEYTTSSTLLSRYNAPPPPPIDPPHHVPPEPYYSDRTMVQEWVPSRSYVFSTVYNANSSSHHSHGYEPYSDQSVTTHSAHYYDHGSVPSASRYSSYHSTAYQSGGYDRVEYPQVSSGVRMQYPQYPPAKAGPVSQKRVPYPKQKKPKPIKPDHYCQICKVRCCTAKDLGFHIQGKKHQSNVEMLQEEGITPTIGPQPEGATDLPKSPSQLAERKRKKMPLGPASTEELEVKKKRVYDAGAAVEGVRVCGVCNIVVNSQKVFDAHCAGSKHAMMLKKLQEGS